LQACRDCRVWIRGDDVADIHDFRAGRFEIDRGRPCSAAARPRLRELPVDEILRVGPVASAPAASRPDPTATAEIPRSERLAGATAVLVEAIDRGAAPPVRWRDSSSRGTRRIMRLLFTARVTLARESHGSAAVRSRLTLTAFVRRSAPCIRSPYS
jgi:hypothetical protein